MSIGFKGISAMALFALPVVCALGLGLLLIIGLIILISLILVVLIRGGRTCLG